MLQVDQWIRCGGRWMNLAWLPAITPRDNGIELHHLDGEREWLPRGDVADDLMSAIVKRRRIPARSESS